MASKRLICRGHFSNFAAGEFELYIYTREVTEFISQFGKAESSSKQKSRYVSFQEGHVFLILLSQVAELRY